jgi:hypothetical protein
MSEPFYVLLTGSKSNAGDFLIKHRARQLLAAFRPDRGLVDFNAWEPLDGERLDTVNRAAALILTGGPALQPDMFPAIYPLTDLSRIRAPILTLGIGWRSADGGWAAASALRLTPATRALLERTAQGGHAISVRDYHTLEALRSNGFRHARMTGCPALYDLAALARPLPAVAPFRRVGFSLGVSFIGSPSMRRQMEDLILRGRDLLGDARFEVLFHHPVDESFLKTHNAPRAYYDGHRDFLGWLEKREIPWLDVSGGAEKMMRYYSGCDLHVGYRVHAHIFMSSIGKPSILLAEDGRGVALKEVLGGAIFPACAAPSRTLAARIRQRLTRVRRVSALPEATGLALHEIGYGPRQAAVRLAGARGSIEAHFPVMKDFLAALP